MEIILESHLGGAKRAKGITVIIDVFRAGNTILSCLSNGAEYVIPVGSLEEAYKLKQEYPNNLLAGERKSHPPEGFDFGNSPSEASTINFDGRGVILTTSSGTQGIVNASGADNILIGTFANISKISEYIIKAAPSTVTLVAMGFESRLKAEEDEFYARFLRAVLQGKLPDFSCVRKKLLESDGANRLVSINKEDDLQSCLTLDTAAYVPYYDRDSGRLKLVD